MEVSEKTEFHLDRNFSGNRLVFGDMQIAQIGRMFCKSITVVERHMHVDLFELTVVTGGLGTVFINGDAVPVSRGDICVNFPCDTHMIVSDRQKPLQFDFFAFTTDSAEFSRELERITQEYHAADDRVFRDERVAALINNALAEFNEKNPYADQLLTGIFRQILIYTVRHFGSTDVQRYTGSMSSAQILCCRLMNYIDTHLYSMSNLEELSEVTGYSYGYLSSLFRKTTGGTLSDYYHEKRLNAAMLLLSEQNLKITQIAEMLNYGSAYSFSKAFHTRFGVSPRACREQKREGAAAAGILSDSVRHQPIRQGDFR